MSKMFVRLAPWLVFVVVSSWSWRAGVSGAAAAALVLVIACPARSASAC
jgi:hypothetical protein